MKVQEKEKAKPVKKETKQEKKTEKVKAEKKADKKQTQQTQVTQNNINTPKRTKKQKAFADKRATLAVKARQTKWAPVWVILKKYGSGKKMHPSAVTAYKRSWRRTKLHIKPRKIRKSHMG